MEKQKAVYSYHTFIFPFLWNDSGRVSRKKFEECLNPDWELDIFGKYNANNTTEKSQLYSVCQYFNTAARAVIFTTEDGQKQPVRNFRFLPKLFADKKHNVTYCINKLVKNYDKDGTETVVTYDYRLRVNGIRLKLYDTGIGLIVYELENTEYTTIDDVNRINDWGRRISRPYYAPDFSCSICADCLSLTGINDIHGNSVCSKLSGATPPDDPRETEIAKVITFLLESEKKSVTLNRSNSKEAFYIEPIIDDRMFTCCYIEDKAFTDKLSERNGDEYLFISDATEKEIKDSTSLARQLYEFVFIDGDGISCHSRSMLKEMLENHIYKRWLEYRFDSGELSGTVYGFSEYSLVCASASSFSSTAFLTEYIEIAMLVLVQRASLLAFERRISEVSRTKRGEKDLQQRYINFDSRYLLLEVSAQQQAIEIYSAMRENMYINAEKEEVEDQIESLFDLKNYKFDKVQNGILFFLSALGVLEVIQVAMELFGK